MQFWNCKVAVQFQKLAESVFSTWKAARPQFFIVQKFPSNPMQELPQYQVLRKYAQQARIFENYPEERLEKFKIKLLWGMINYVSKNNELCAQLIFDDIFWKKHDAASSEYDIDNDDGDKIGAWTWFLWRSRRDLGASVRTCYNQGQMIWKRGSKVKRKNWRKKNKGKKTKKKPGDKGLKNERKMKN